MPEIRVNGIDYNFNEERSSGGGNRCLVIGINGEAYGYDGRPKFLLKYIDPAGQVQNIHTNGRYNANIAPFYVEVATEAATWQQTLGYNVWPDVDATHEYRSTVLNATIRLIRLPQD